MSTPTKKVYITVALPMLDIIYANDNAFQEPLHVFSAEYLWNCDDNRFYRVEQKPSNYPEFMEIYRSTVNFTFALSTSVP